MRLRTKTKQNGNVKNSMSLTPLSCGQSIKVTKWVVYRTRL